MTEPKNISDKCTFELLSAYLDSEVTPSERKQVEQLLKSDPQTQQLYKRLQLLRDGFQNLPSPEPQYSSQELANHVFTRIDQESKTRKRWFWGGTAIAAMLIASLATMLAQPNKPILKFAEEEETESLMIALNRPLIEIPTEQKPQETESLMIPINHSLIDTPPQ